MIAPQAPRRLARPAIIYLTAFLVSNAGVGGFTLAIGLMMYEQTGSAALFGAVVAAEFGLGLLGQVVGTGVIDRLNVVTLAAALNACRGLAVALGVLVAYVTHSATALAMAVLLSSVIRPAYRSASFAVVPRVCAPDELVRVNGLRVGLLQVGQMAGLGLVGGLVVILRTEQVLLVVAAVLLVAGALMQRLNRYRQLHESSPTKSTRAGRTTGTGRPGEWRELFGAVRSTPTVAAHWLLGSLAPIVAAALTVFVAPVNDGLHGGRAGIVVLDGAFAVGAFAAVLISRRLAATGLPPAVAAGMAITAMGLLVLAASGHLLLAAVGFLVSGVGMALTALSLDSLLQVRTDQAILGRVAMCQEFTTSIMALVLVPISGRLVSGDRFAVAPLAFAAVTTVFLVLYGVGWLLVRNRLLTHPLGPTGAAVPLGVMGP